MIASDSSGLREAAGGYATAQLVTPGDAESVAAALTDIHARWDEIVSTVADSRAEALRRHAPDVYRASITAHVLP